MKIFRSKYLRWLTAPVLMFVCFSQVFALPADVDPAFGIIIINPNYPALYPSAFRTIAIMPNDELVFAGYANRYSYGGNYNSSVWRTFPGSRLQPEVDSRCAGASTFAAYLSSAVQADGKLLLAGYTMMFVAPNWLNKYLIVRCNADATLDTTFNGTGFINANFGSQTESYADSLMVRPNGKIAVLASGPGVAQFNSDGTPDMSFGQGGFAPSLNPSAGTAAALQPDGKIILAGPSYGATFTLTRILPDGSPDLTFGNAGIVETVIGANNSSLGSVKVQPDGKIVAVGTSSDSNGTDRRAVIVRYQANGTLDGSFGANGIVLSSFSTKESAFGVDFQANGKIVVGGASIFGTDYPHFAVFRFNRNGTPDLSFGASGIFVETSLFSAWCNTVRVQGNGKIIAAGGETVPTQVALRLKGDGGAEAVRFDFDGDGKSDISTFRPSSTYWNLLRSEAGSTAIQWGLSTDTLVPADFDGDGKTNVAVYRNGAWKIIWKDGSYHQVAFGLAGDLPRPGDFDGDGKADIAVWRPSTGFWFWLNSSNGQYNVTQFGTNGDVPLIADFDGDGKTDRAVFRPSAGNWFYLASRTGSYNAVHFGTEGDIPVPADFDGDGRTDISVFRPSNGVWYRLNSSNGQYVAAQFGTNGDVPVAGDYDGDYFADIAVFRPSNNVWYLLNSSTGFAGVQYGAAADRPLPAAYGP